MKDLDYLARQWLRAKEHENDAKEKRLEIEQEIEKLIPGEDEKTVNSKTDQFNVFVTRKLNYVIDPVQYERFKETPGLPIRFKKEIDMKLYRAIQLTNSSLRPVCDAIFSVKPAKLSINIEELEE